MLDAIAAKYAECATERLPLRYVIVFLFVLLVLLAASRANSLDTLSSLMSLRVLDFASSQFWVALDINVGDIAIAASVVFIGILAERVLAEGLLFLANRSSRFREKISRKYLQISRDDRDAVERSASLDVLEIAVKPVANRFLNSLCISQFCFSTSMVLMIVQRSSVDAAIACLLFFLAAANTMRSLTIFISAYYPLLALRQALLGLPAHVYPGLRG